MDYKYECIQCCGRARDFGEAQVRKRMGGRTGVAASNPMMQVGTAGAQGGDNPMMQVGMMRGMEDSEAPAGREREFDDMSPDELYGGGVEDDEQYELSESEPEEVSEWIQFMRDKPEVLVPILPGAGAVVLIELPDEPEKDGEVVWVAGQAFIATTLAGQIGWLLHDGRPAWAQALPKDELQLAALETLLQCEMAEVTSSSTCVLVATVDRFHIPVFQGVEVDQLFDDVGPFRTNMLCTRRAVTALFEHQIPAGEHEPSCSVTARLAPLLARRLGDFESKQAMAGWFDRQVAVALAGICQYLSRGGKMAPVDDAALGELYSTALQSFDGLKDGVAGSDEEAIKGAVELLMQVFDNPDFGFAAHMLPTDAAGQRSASLLGHAAPLPYPLNAEHYMTLVLATFDPDEVGLLEPHSSEQLQVLLRHQTRLGLSEQQHQLCMVRCHYLAYLRAVTTDYSPNVEESLGLLQNAVAEFKAGYEGYEQTDVGSELEGSVLSSLLIEVTERLADYHATFTENELYANTIRGNFELLVELKFAHLESFSKELKKARQAMVLQLTKSSVRTFYRRLADALAATQEEKAEKDIAALEAAGQDYDLDRNGRPQRRGGGAGEEEEDEGTALADLAEFLAEEAVIPVIERADQFSPFCAKAPHVAVKELVRCFGSDLKQLVSGFKEMGPAMETLLQSVGLLIDAAAELLGEGAALSKLHKSVVMPFVPLVEKDLRSQRDRFDKLCRQSIENENWSPVNQDSSISSSVYDIFAMIGQQIPVMLGSGLLLDDSIAKQFIRNIDSCVMAYALHVSQGIADPPPVVSRVAKKKRRGSVDAVADLARAGSGGEALEEEDEEAIDDIPGAVAAFEEPVEETVENCVRLNSLFFAADRVVEFSEQFAYAMELDPQTAPDDRPFAGSLEIVEQCREGALAYVSAKIVCFELAEHFYRGLYVPTPSEARFGPQVLENLEDFMGELVDLVTEPLVFKALLGSILDAVVATTEELLRRGGPTRTYQPTDVAIFYEDFAELESWFMAGGKGLELEEIEERTMKLHKIADGQKFASGKDAVPKSQEQTKKSGATQEKLDAAKKRTEDSKEKARKELAEAKAKTKESMSKMNDQSKAAMRKMMKPGFRRGSVSPTRNRRDE